MSKKVRKKIVGVLIATGICISIMNFAPNLYAPPIFGTVTSLNESQIEMLEIAMGAQWVEDRHIEGEFYCLGEESDCTVVF